MRNIKRRNFKYVEYTGVRPKMPNCDGLISAISQTVGFKTLTFEERKTLLEILREIEQNHKILKISRREELRKVIYGIYNEQLKRQKQGITKIENSR